MNFMKIGGSTAWRIITQPISDRSLFGVITGLRHVDLAHRFFRAISAWRSSHLSALRHGDPVYRHLRAISTWQSSHLLSLRHGDPAHRYFRGIPAWRTIPQPISKRFLSGVITGLRHGDLAYRYSSAIPTCRTITQALSNRPLTGPRPVLATATLPTDTSAPSPRAETSQNRSLKDVPSGS